MVHLPKMPVRAANREKVPLHGRERRITASKAGQSGTRPHGIVHFNPRGQPA